MKCCFESSLPSILRHFTRRLDEPLEPRVFGVFRHFPGRCYPEIMKFRFLFLSLPLLLPVVLAAQSLKEFEKKVTDFTLPNGLHFLVIERHEAPVVSFHTYVN